MVVASVTSTLSESPSLLKSYGTSLIKQRSSSASTANRQERDFMIHLLSGAVCVTIKAAAVGAQTGRRGFAVAGEETACRRGLTGQCCFVKSRRSSSIGAPERGLPHSADTRTVSVS